MTPMNRLDLADIVRACRQEATRHKSEEEGYCFELFRRALDGRVDGAWAAVQAQYEALVLSWLHRTTGGGLPPDEVTELLQETYARFWRGIVGGEGRVAGRFAHVGALLRYLNQCAVSACQDRRRRLDRQRQLRRRLEQAPDAVPLVHHEDPAARLDRERLWQRVQRWIRREVTDELEQLVLVLSYERGLTPTEIVSQYPEKFATTADVRRVKERVLKRARRALVD